MEVAIQIFEGLQTTTYIKFDLLKSQSWVTYYKTLIAFVLEKHWICDKCIPKILLQIQNQSNFIHLWWKKKGTANLYRTFSQYQPISVAFTVILKITLPQCNTTGVCTLPDFMVVVQGLASFYSDKLFSPSMLVL